MELYYEEIAAHAASARAASVAVRDATLRLRSELHERRLTRIDAAARAADELISTSPAPSPRFPSGRAAPG